MSENKFEPTAEELEFLKRPLTADEKAAAKGMPPPMVQGYIRRKRAQEIAEKRGEATQAKWAKAVEDLGALLDTFDRKHS